MSLPYFFVETLAPVAHDLVLPEGQSKHIVQVLRMQKEEELFLTDGKGNKVHAIIIDDHRKRCQVKIISIEKAEARLKNISIAISLTKNLARFEWFLEKATEIGVSEIIPLICERTEKQNFRFERMKNILLTAMLQSQQSLLPVLHEPTKFNQLLSNSYQTKYIAHCIEEQKRNLKDQQTMGSAIILIGPEGDFTRQEIDLAKENNFMPVALGTTRLRIETAGIVAATLLCI